MKSKINKEIIKKDLKDLKDLKLLKPKLVPKFAVVYYAAKSWLLIASFLKEEDAIKHAEQFDPSDVMVTPFLGINQDCINDPFFNNSCKLKKEDREIAVYLYALYKKRE